MFHLQMQKNKSNIFTPTEETEFPETGWGGGGG